MIPLLLINRACVSSRNSHMVSNHTVHVLFYPDRSPEQELQDRDLITWAATGVDRWRTVFVSFLWRRRNHPTDRLKPCGMFTDICVLIHTFTRSHDPLKGSSRPGHGATSWVQLSRVCVWTISSQSYVLYLETASGSVPAWRPMRPQGQFLSANSRDATRLETFQNFLASL